ncbi:hypothetical protein CBM2586_A50172 [Cupriavidus phytorum]|uniref:Uncharacterized protein n=1 Tax=Cupriavidus taiwanensis TaxID=164546 RepID=A0A375C372_9BURK|nr:hypothetical protein CBM2586_A50172 [Cupriavidus taiwanensis]
MFYRMEGPGLRRGRRLSRPHRTARAFSDHSHVADCAAMSHFHAGSCLPVSLMPAV